MASHRSLALLPAGVYRASTSRCCWCALTAPLHPCLCRHAGHRRCVSVALSSRSPALGVTQQAWPSGSPDFPQSMGRTSLLAVRLRSPRLLSDSIMPLQPRLPGFVLSIRGLICLLLRGPCSYCCLSDTFTSPGQGSDEQD